MLLVLSSVACRVLLEMRHGTGNIRIASISGFKSDACFSRPLFRNDPSCLSSMCALRLGNCPSSRSFLPAKKIRRTHRRSVHPPAPLVPTAHIVTVPIANLLTKILGQHKSRPPAAKLFTAPSGRGRAQELFEDSDTRKQVIGALCYGDAL